MAVDGVNGVQVVAAGTTNYSTFTTNGSYLLSVCPGHYTITPTQACRLFSPASWAVDVGPATNQVNFFAYSNNLSRIRGQITDGVIGLANVPVTATGGLTSRPHRCERQLLVLQPLPGHLHASPRRSPIAASTLSL